MTLIGKKPGVGWTPQVEDLSFSQQGSADMRPYDRLIGAALNGERWLFAREETVEAAWRVVDPVLDDVTPVHAMRRAAGGRGGRCAAAGRRRPGTTPSRDPPSGALAWTRQHDPRRASSAEGSPGLFAARALRRAPVDVVLVDRAEHHLFQPLLYQCATGILSEGQIAAPLRDLLRRHHNVDCVLARCRTSTSPGAV